ncbi:MAG: hypothetical protein A3J84_06755 [Ignavibacteria bacterium RIFOXYA2_FULL_37_17]|nr:MAG: hypothetical protein A3J84_06755 [Ignavibacteria bacterium RIFOXYA2_FULL_37_17]
MNKTVQKLLSQIFLTVILLFLFVLNTAAQFEEGALVKGNKEAVFLISKGKACWIPNENVFNLLGLNWNKVKKVSDKDLAKIPKGWIIVKGRNEPLYIIESGTACKVTNASTLKALGLDNNSIWSVPDEKLAKLPQRPLLVKGSEASVYLIHNSKACWIPDESVLKALGYDIKMVIQIPDKEMIQIPKSQLLLRGSSDKIYRIENSKRRWITGAVLFTRLGYDWNSVLNVSDIQLKNIPEGEPLK